MPNDVHSRNDDRRKRTLGFIASLKGKVRILDIGCQSGTFCGALRELGHEPYGIEISSRQVKRAQNMYPDIPIIQANCEKTLPFPDSHFDVVWAGEVIEHIGHTDVFLNEINRVLRPGGHFILSTPMHNRIKGLLIVLFKFEKHFDPEFPHYRFYTKKSLCGVLKRRGFEIVEVGYIGRIPLLANVIFMVAKKVMTKPVLSEWRERSDNRELPAAEPPAEIV